MSERPEWKPDGWHDFEDADAMAEACADKVAGVIEQALADRNRIAIALPGGSTPVAAFELLAAKSLEWEKITILPSDDRLVGFDDPLSNHAQLARFFGRTGARLVPLLTPGTDPVVLAEETNERLEAVPWPLDLVWLGVGADGHTASVFPGPDYAEALRTPHKTLVVRPDPLPPEAPVARITLSPAAIRASRRCIVSLRGVDKRNVLLAALSDGFRSRFPAGPVIANTGAEIFWSP